MACEKGNDIPTDLYKKFLLVTDYIFGMTDSFLMYIYKDPEIHDLILTRKNFLQVNRAHFPLLYMQQIDGNIVQIVEMSYLGY